MCSSVGLVVEGIALGSGSQYFSRMTMKREYNTKCFWMDRFCHEVANHYREQQQLGPGCVSRNASHRRRKRIPSVKKSREPALLASGYAQFRDVWPTHVHYFPRFGGVLIILYINYKYSQLKIYPYTYKHLKAFLIVTTRHASACLTLVIWLNMYHNHTSSFQLMAGCLWCQHFKSIPIPYSLF